MLIKKGDSSMSPAELSNIHPVNELLGGELVPNSEELKQAQERLLKKGLRDPQERIAFALEGFTAQLRAAFPDLDENSGG